MAWIRPFQILSLSAAAVAVSAAVFPKLQARLAALSTPNTAR